MSSIIHMITDNIIGKLNILLHLNYYFYTYFRRGYKSGNNFYGNKRRGRGGHYRNNRNYDAMTHYDRVSQYSDKFDVHSTHSQKGKLLLFWFFGIDYNKGYKHQNWDNKGI